MAEIEKQEVDSTADKGRGRASLDRDWTKGSIIRNLLDLSWPIIISGSLNMLGPTVDMIWVGKLGVASMAGVGIAGMAFLVVRLGIIGINTGMRAMIARFFGEGDIAGANHVAQQSFFISVVYAITVATIGILFAEPILRLTGVEAEVVSEGTAYMRIMFIATVSTSFHIMADGVMQSSGDAVTPMRISFIVRTTHVVLVPFLVFGWWIFPRLGVSGAAWSGVVTQSLAMILATWVVFTGRSRLRLTMRNFRLDFSMIWRILKIGIPASVAMAQQNFGRLVLMFFIIPFGTTALAAHSLIERIELFIVTPGMGFGQSASVLVGQNLGAQQPGRAEKSTWLAVGFTGGIMAILSVVIIVWSGGVIRIFNPEPDMVAVASVFLRIAMVGYIAYALNIILMRALSGAGDTMPSMLITLLSTWVVTVPLAYFLPRVADLGMYGVRWAIVVGMVIGAIVYVVYFRLGRWKHKKV